MFSDDTYNPRTPQANGNGVPLWVLPLILTAVLTLAGLVRSVATQGASRLQPAQGGSTFQAAEPAARTGG